MNYLSREADALGTADEIRALRRRAVAVKGDVSKSADVAAMIAAAESGLGPIDILVNNAGRATFQSIEQMTEASWNETLAVNLTSVFLLSQAVLPGMRAREWGRIINLASVAAQAGSVLAVHYSAAKAGVIAATKSYARLLAKEGITVNAIAPALIGTEMVVSNPHVKPDIGSRRAFWPRRRMCRRGRAACEQRLHHGANDRRQRRDVPRVVATRLERGEVTRLHQRWGFRDRRSAELRDGARVWAPRRSAVPQVDSTG